MNVVVAKMNYMDSISISSSFGKQKMSFPIWRGKREMVCVCEYLEVLRLINAIRLLQRLLSSEGLGINRNQIFGGNLASNGT